jgi:hypothetical protein
MGSINVNMGVPRTGLLAACLESSGFSRLLTATFHIDTVDLYAHVLYRHQGCNY